MPQVYSRRKGADPMPLGTIYVGRGTPWGNIYRMYTNKDRDRVCDAFEVYAHERLATDADWLKPLVGHDLACWCQYPSQNPRLRCHAETLLRLANDGRYVSGDATSDVYELSLGKGKVARVSADDYQRVSAFKWSCSRSRDKDYAMRKDPCDKTIYLHRFLMDAPPHLKVDHIDGDGLNCTRSNMRLATNAQNIANQPTRPRRLYKGVRYLTRKRIRCYQAFLGDMHLGYHDNAENAARAYNTAALEKYGEFAVLNPV